MTSYKPDDLILQIIVSSQLLEIKSKLKNIFTFLDRVKFLFYVLHRIMIGFPWLTPSINQARFLVSQKTNADRSFDATKVKNIKIKRIKYQL